jgi:putative transposase
MFTGPPTVQKHNLAQADVFDNLDAFYNRTLRHSNLGGVSPEVFESASI